MPTITIRARMPKLFLASSSMRIAVYCRMASLSQTGQIKAWQDNLSLLTRRQMGEIDYLMMKLQRRGTAKKGW